jgi:hypothetical protein
VNNAYFYLGSHTFTHEDLNNCSYTDAYSELIYNRNFATAAGWSNLPTWSNFSMVSPGISGVFNGDALKAFVDAGYSSIVGDTSRPNIGNPINSRWPWITSISSSNYEGFSVIPRFPTAIYFNSSVR